MKKKRIILASILGAAALFAGASIVTAVVSNNANRIQENFNDGIEESDLAEDSVFGTGIESIIVNKEVKKKESTDALLTPVIGRQYAYDSTTGKVSIRFIAAVSSLDVDAVWRRTLYNSDGSVNRTGTYKSTKAYTTLAYKYKNDKNEDVTETQTAEEFAGKGYNYFVLYTLKNIPILDCSSIEASLEISNDAYTEVSKTGSVATTSTADISSYEASLTIDGNYSYKSSSNTSAGNGQYINGKLKTIYSTNDTSLNTDYISLGLTKTYTNTTESSNYYYNDSDFSQRISFSGFSQTAGAHTIKVQCGATAASYDIYVLATDCAYQDANNNYVVTVDKSYTGIIGAVSGTNGNMFTTISQALEFLQNDTFVPTNANKILNIGAGYYKEKLEITTPNLTIKGSGTLAKGTYSSDENYNATDYAKATIIEYDTLFGQDAPGLSDVNYKHTTDSTQTVAVRDTATNCKIDGVTISNAWNCTEYFTAKGASSEHRALALLVQADAFQMSNSALLGYQDTLELMTGRQYFKSCYISGTTDFIFGTNNITMFDECEIHSINSGYVNAFKGCNKGASDYVEYGAIYNNCNFTANSDVVSGSVSVARPWGDYSAVAVVNSNIGGHISTQPYAGGTSGTRYVSMNSTPDNANVKFVEYNNTGAGAISESQTGVTVLTAEAAANYTNYSVVFGKNNGALYNSLSWNPTSPEAFVDDRIVYSFRNDVTQYNTVSKDNIHVFTSTFNGNSGLFEDISVDASNGKLQARGNDTQINANTTLTFTVAAKTEVAVSAYDGDSISINGIMSPNSTFGVYFETETTVVVKCEKNTYLYSIIIDPNEESNNVKYSSLSVSGYDEKELKVGETYNIPTLVVKAINSDNTYYYVTSGYTVDTTNVDNTEAGDYEVTVSYNGKTATYPVYYRSVNHISCDGYTDYYLVGENINFDNMLVKAYLSEDDSNYYQTSNYTISVEDPDGDAFDYSSELEKVGNYIVTVTHEGVSKSFIIEVAPADTIKYTVSFVTSGTEVAEQSIVSGQKVDTTAISTSKDGYVFKGWFTDSEYNNAFDFDTLIIEDITLYARFVANADLTLENCIYYFDGTEGNNINSFKYDKGYQKGESWLSLSTSGKVYYYSDASRTQFNKDSYVLFAVGKNATITVEMSNTNSSNYSILLNDSVVVDGATATSSTYTTSEAGTIKLINNGPNQMYLKTIKVTYPTYIEENTTISFGSSGNYKDLASLQQDSADYGQVQSNCCQIKGTIAFYVNPNAKITISSFSGYTNYSITASGASNDTQTGTSYSFVCTNGGKVELTASTSNNYIYSITISYPTYLSNASITFGTEGNYTNMPIDIEGINTFNTNNSKLTGTAKIYVKAGTLVSVDAYGGSNSSYTITANNITTDTLNEDYSVFVKEDSIVIITGSSNNYLNGITITQAQFIENSINVSFGKDGNYETSGIDFSECTTNSPNGDQANNQLIGDMVFYVRSGAIVTIDGYDDTNYCSYTVVVNGIKLGSSNNDYSFTTTENSRVVVTCASNNYINGVSIVYGLEDQSITFGTSGNFNDCVTNKIVSSTVTNSTNSGYSQVKEGNISFVAKAGTTITITGYYSVDYRITIGSESTLVQGTDSASKTKVFSVTNTSEIIIACQTGENYTTGNYLTSIVISKS